MATGLLARKIGMTQIFGADGDCIPVTVLECGPCTVVRRKTADRDGYEALLLGFGPVEEKHARRLSKAEVGVFKKAGTGIFRSNEYRYTGRRPDCACISIHFQVAYPMNMSLPRAAADSSASASVVAA